MRGALRCLAVLSLLLAGCAAPAEPAPATAPCLGCDGPLALNGCHDLVVNVPTPRVQEALPDGYEAPLEYLQLDILSCKSAVLEGTVLHDVRLATVQAPVVPPAKASAPGPHYYALEMTVSHAALAVRLREAGFPAEVGDIALAPEGHAIDATVTRGDARYRVGVAGVPAEEGFTRGGFRLHHRAGEVAHWAQVNLTLDFLDVHRSGFVAHSGGALAAAALLPDASAATARLFEGRLDVALGGQARL